MMNFSRYILIVCALASLIAIDARAQQMEIGLALDGPAVGVYGGIARGTLDADFNITSDGPTDDRACGRFESGSHDGFVAGVLAEIPLTRVFGLVGGAEFSSRDASLSYPCVDPSGTRMPDGSIAQAVTEFRADAGYDLVGLNIGASIRPFSFPLMTSVTSSFSICTDARYSASEAILSPMEASFVDGGQERSIGTGAFETGDIAVGLAVSLWYEARIAGRWSLVPRIGAFVGLTDEIASSAIRSRGIDATLGIVYRIPTGADPSSPIEAGSAPSR